MTVYANQSGSPPVGFIELNSVSEHLPCIPDVTTSLSITGYKLLQL